VSGLGIGWRLAQAGWAVDVFERGRAGHGASWAAAGMLAAGVEAEPGEETLLALNLASQRLWPAFARELEAASGIDVGLRTEGTLVVATNQDEAAELRFRFDFQRRLGIEVEWLDGRSARRREPYLRPGVVGAVWSPDDHQVDNRRVVRALALAFVLAGGRLHEDMPVEHVEIEAGRARGVVAGGRTHMADVVVLAAGAWSREVAGLPDAVRPPVRPLKGQMLALRMDPAAPVVDHVLWGPNIYLVPRRDGRLIVGGTVEERGFDPNLTAGGVFGLLEAAWRLVPTIEELPIDEMWVGFRPTSRDDAPILGPTAVEGLVMATGHHRNGILLTPVTADSIGRFLATGRLDAALTPFLPGRFATAAGEPKGGMR